MTEHAKGATSMTNDEIREMALALLRADSEEEVVAILTDLGLWDDRALWRLYGDKEGNWAAAGNQQAAGEAAIVEKIVNSADSRLMLECLRHGIHPESKDAPTSLRDAVAMFFEGKSAKSDEAGTLANWARNKRTEEARHITLAATGNRPAPGRRSKAMCITIVDQAEGQSPARLPYTILSLNAKNKQRIRFVQGKFNMGGSGALRFCGQLGLQLVISRRHPDLAKHERENDSSVDQWSVTVVRREEPSNRSGDPIHSEFTYLAPLGANGNPRKGSVLRFDADELPILPHQDEPYARSATSGTAIKLYEYKTLTKQSNVLMKDGLLYALERLLPEIALPIRVHECRGYKGEKERSFETTLSGLVVRLEDGKGDNLESGFPLSARLRAAGLDMRVRIYAFKEGKAATYLDNEGVIFEINGQAHGYLPNSIFTRPKAVGLSRLKDSVLVLVDCSGLSVRQREDLFMPSRDRLSKEPIRYEVEREVEAMLKINQELRNLQNARRAGDVESKLSEEKPLEEVLGKVLKASPTLKTLFLQGQRLANPFGGRGGKNKGEGGGADKGDDPFKGKRHPSFFRFEDANYGEVFKRNCELERRVRIKYVTDVENEYFDRATDRGRFDAEVLSATREVADPSYSVTLESGVAVLNMALPPEVEVGDKVLIQTTVNDSTLDEPFVNILELTVSPKQQRLGGDGTPTKPRGSGAGNNPTAGGISLPKVIPVKEDDSNWKKYSFTPDTACHVISDSIEVSGKLVMEHVFYINVHNTSLKTEMKYSKQDSRVLEAKFKYGNILLGLAMLHEDNGTKKRGDIDDQENMEGQSVQDRIRQVTRAVAPVLLPMIDQLSGLDENQLEELSSIGEDG
ncbi:MAG: hypothetical protein KDA16_00825 [Phycisphaerales bacterium]|nr:hypothetical protein [Phycisphaerales bacterium]